MSFTGSATTRMPSRWLVARGGTGSASYRLLAQAHAWPGHGCVYVLIGCATLRILCEVPPTSSTEADRLGGEADQKGRNDVTNELPRASNIYLISVIQFLVRLG